MSSAQYLLVVLTRNQQLYVILSPESPAHPADMYSCMQTATDPLRSWPE